MPFQGLTGRVAYAGLYAVSFWGLTLGGSFRAAGRRNVPKSGPVLFVSNHQSLIDPWLVALAVAPRKLTHLARSDLFRHTLAAKAIRTLGAIPIDRGFGRDGLRLVSDRLAAGDAVLVFPEGSRTHDGRVQPLKPGVAILARTTTVIPVGIAGAFEAWPRGRKVPYPSPLFWQNFVGSGLAVVIGEAIPAGTLADADRNEVTRELQQQITHVQRLAEALRRK